MSNNNNIDKSQCTIKPEPTNLNQCTITSEPTKLNQYAIPTEPTNLNQCTVWAEEEKDNAKMAKLPIDPNTGSYAKVNEPST